MVKKKTKILACVLAGVLLLVAALSVFIASHFSGFYTEAQHIGRVRERAEKRYLSEGSEYTSLEVYPLYNEKDELSHMLIELQPQGFMYVQINDSFFSPFGGAGMYTRAKDGALSWKPYRVKIGMRDEFTTEEGQTDVWNDVEFVRDEKGQVIVHHESHFKVAGISDERRYLLARSRRYSGWMPAVRRGTQYLNLVDGELMDYEVDKDYSEVYPTAQVGFTAKSYFDL